MSRSQLRIQKHFLSFVLLALLCFATTAQATSVWFTAPELRVAARDLTAFLSDRTKSEVTAELTGVNASPKRGDWVLVNLAKTIPASIERSLSSEHKAFLQTNGPESFLAVNLEGIRYLVGGGHRGTTYASIRIQKVWIDSATPPLSVEFELLRTVPAFKERIGGAGGPHPNLDYSQPMPSDYDWQAYAHALAAAGINLTPGIIQGKIVPDEVLRPWGIGKILFYSSNPFSANDLRRWRQSNPQDVKPAENPRTDRNQASASDSSGTHWMLCIQTDFGKERYLEWLKQALSEHKEAEKLVFFFADWGLIPPSDCQAGGRPAQRIQAFVNEISKMAKPLAPDLQLLVASRGLGVSDLRELTEAKIGLYFEEPSQTLLDPPESGYEPILSEENWNPEYQACFLNALKAMPDKVILVIAAGDTDGTVSPAIGMAMPGHVYRKIQRLSQLPVQNLALAMGGIHPWSYSVNVEIFKEMIWNPNESEEELLQRLAQRDFGKAANSIRTAWNTFDQAFALMPAISQDQSLERFIRGIEATQAAPLLSPSQLRGEAGKSSSAWNQSMTKSVPFIATAYPEVLSLLTQGVQCLQQAQDIEDSSGEGLVPGSIGQSQERDTVYTKNLRDSLFWTGFHLHLLRSQYNLLRYRMVLPWIPEDTDVTTQPWKEVFKPIYRDEAANCTEWQNLLFTAPEEVLRLEHEPLNTNALGRKFDQKRQSLESAIENRM